MGAGSSPTEQKQKTSLSVFGAQLFYSLTVLVGLVVIDKYQAPVFYQGLLGLALWTFTCVAHRKLDFNTVRCFANFVFGLFAAVAFDKTVTYVGQYVVCFLFALHTVARQDYSSNTEMLQDIKKRLFLQ